jgi:licheninase
MLTAALGSWVACAAREPHDAGSGSSPGARALVWVDEFDNDGLPDSSKWDYEVGGHGWGNKELQFYTGARRENARVEEGHLVIEARRDFFESHEYTSARLLSKAQWMSGRFEVRAKLPCARGTWPAIWMLPAAKRAGMGWPDTGEIDIMEHVGHDPGVIHASIHTGAYNWPTRTQKTATLSVPDACSAFHTYALDWTPSGMRAYVDDREYFQFPNERLSNPSATTREWPFDVPFAFRLNVAVGGMWGGEQGVDAAAFPQRMEIDFVRVYRVRGN